MVCQNRKPAFFLKTLGTERGEIPLLAVPVAQSGRSQEGQVRPCSDLREPAVASAPAAEPRSGRQPSGSTTAKVLDHRRGDRRELRLSQENSPPPSTVTFAPEQADPLAALPRPRSAWPAPNPGWAQGDSPIPWTSG